MSRAIITRTHLNSDTQARLEKLRAEITDILFERGHRIDINLIKDVAEIVYMHEDKAFYKKDFGEL